MDANQLRNQLAGFTGSETFTRHPLTSRVLLTEGATFLAEQAQAWWLTDAIASYLTDARASREEFQVWKLTVDAAKRSVFIRPRPRVLRAGVGGMVTASGRR